MTKFLSLARFISMVLLTVGISASCSYSSLSGGGASVVAAPNLTVTHCRYIGTVVGEGGGGGGGWVTNSSLIKYAMNDLRNKAAAMGATHVVTASPQLGSTQGTTTSATVTGTAYDCSGSH
mgnify:CR=1 FL=1